MDISIQQAINFDKSIYESLHFEIGKLVEAWNHYNKDADHTIYSMNEIDYILEGWQPSSIIHSLSTSKFNENDDFFWFSRQTGLITSGNAAAALDAQADYIALETDLIENRDSYSEILDYDDILEISTERTQADWENILQEIWTGDIATALHWGLSDSDMQALTALYRNGDEEIKKDIFDLLTECNYHTEAASLAG